MTQHILMIWMATAVATFSGLVGCTSMGAASTRAAVRAVQVTRAQSAFLDNILRAVGLRTPIDEALLAEAAQARIEFDAWPGRIFAGRVSNISSAAGSDTGTVTIEVQVL